MSEETVLSLIEDRLYQKWRSKAMMEFLWDPPKDTLKLPVVVKDLAVAEASARAEWIEERVSQDRIMLIERLFTLTFTKFHDLVDSDT